LFERRVTNHFCPLKSEKKALLHHYAVNLLGLKKVSLKDIVTVATNLVRTDKEKKLLWSIITAQNEFQYFS